MKLAVAAAVAAGAFSASSHALQLQKPADPAVIAIPFEQKRTTEHASSASLRRRGTKTVSQTLDNFEQGSLYFANVTLGTPAQNFRFHLDTGSSDLWTNAAASRYCKNGGDSSEGGDSCDVSGTYDANSSSTYQYVDGEFVIKYADQSGARGDYVKDTLRIGGISLTQLQFGVGYVSSSAEGVMGIGYPSLEVQSEDLQETAYNNIPQAMTQQGFINSPAYSLWLDDLSSSTGSILFGGVDTEKYVGELVTVPIQQEPLGGGSPEYLEVIIALSGVYLNNGGSNTSITSSVMSVLLDSGSTLSYLPTAAATKIYNALGVTWDDQQQQAFCPCSLASSSATLQFSFSGQVISVRMNEMVLQGGVQGSTKEGCVFGIFQEDSSASGTTYTLGDTFLRSAYVVYDLKNNAISLAPTNFNAASSNIMEITAGSNSVPNAVGVASAASALVTGTGSPVNGQPGATGSVTSKAFAAPTAVAHLGAWGAGAAGLLLAAL